MPIKYLTRNSPSGRIFDSEGYSPETEEFSPEEYSPEGYSPETEGYSPREFFPEELFPEELSPEELSPEEFSPDLNPSIEEIKETAEKYLNDLGNYIESLYAAFDGSPVRKKILDLVRDSRRAYYTEQETTNFPWKNASNMITPLTTMGVDEVEPRLAAAVIGREPLIKAKECLGTSTPEEAALITKFDNFILTHRIPMKKLVPEMIHEQLLDGTIYPLVSWETSSKKARRMIPDPTSPNGLSKTVIELSTSGPQLSLVPVDFVWHADDIDDEDWEDADVIRYVGSMTVDDLRKRASIEDGWFLPEDLTRYETSVRHHKTIQQETEGAQSYDYDKVPGRRPIEFYEAFINYPSFETGAITKLIVLVEVHSFEVFRIREQIDVIDENVKPLRRIRFLKRRGISWGYPLYTLIAGIQLGIDAMWNRCINSADITMTPWGFIKRGMSGLRKSRMEVFPGNLVEIDNPEAINFPNLSMFQPNQFVPLILQYVSFFERTLNVNDFMQGRESQIVGKKGSTATGTLAILQEGKVKFEYRGGQTHIEYLDLFKIIHDLCVSNMPIEDMIKICGQPITKYSSEEEYIFLLTGSDLTSNRFVDRQETESFMATMQPFWQLINPMTMLQDVLESYQKEPQYYINPELAQIVQQWMMVKQNEEAMTQLGLPPEIAKQAAQAGFTPENVEVFIKQLGKEIGKERFQPEEKETEKKG